MMVMIIVMIMMEMIIITMMMAMIAMMMKVIMIIEMIVKISLINYTYYNTAMFRSLQYLMVVKMSSHSTESQDEATFSIRSDISYDYHHL